MKFITRKSAVKLSKTIRLQIEDVLKAHGIKPKISVLNKLESNLFKQFTYKKERR